MVLVKASFGMDANHEFPQSVLAVGVIPLLRDVVGIVVSKACVGCEMGLPLCSVASITCRGWGLLPSCWSGSPDGWALSWLCSLQVCVFSFSCTRTFALKQRNAKASGAYSLTLVIH